jgi:hypothetical protein
LILDLISTDGAFGVPAMTTLQRGSVTPRAGAILFDTDLELFMGTLDGTGSWTSFGLNDEGIGLIDPTLETWTTLNQASGTFTEDTTNKRMTINADGNGALNVRGWYFTAPAAPYAYRAKITGTWTATNSTGLCFGFRENATGELSLIHYYISTAPNNALAVLNWTSPTVFSAAAFAPTTYNMQPSWFKIEDDNTNRIYSYSSDGVNWIDIYSVARTTFLTADRIFFGVVLAAATTPDTQVSLLSLERIN